MILVFANFIGEVVENLDQLLVFGLRTWDADSTRDGKPCFGYFR